MSKAYSLRAYYRIEARSAPWRIPLAASLAGAAAILGAHAIVAGLPARVIVFFEQAFRVQGMAAVLVMNDFLAVYFVAFFVAIAGSLQSTVAAREENRLEILMAKPLRGRSFLAARVLPILCGAAASGIAVGTTISVAIAEHVGPAATVTVAGAFGASLLLTALGVSLAALLLPLFVRLGDTFLALLLACLAWLVPVMPTAAFMYRPDLFEGRPVLSELVVLSSLVWNDSDVVWVGPVALLVAAVGSMLLVAVAGRVLERGDAR